MERLQGAKIKALYGFRSDIEVVGRLVPKLLDAYAELFEMSLAMTKAWEQLEASKNSLYVPDAQELVENHHGRN